MICAQVCVCGKAGVYKPLLAHQNVSKLLFWFSVCTVAYIIVIYHNLLNSIFLFYLICGDSFVYNGYGMKNSSVVEGWVRVYVR